MATLTLPFLLLLSFLVTTALARPCKTLFYFSATTTTTYYPSNSLNRNPNDPNYAQIANPRYITLIFTTTAAPRFPSRHFDRFHEIAQSSPSEFPLSSVSSSVRDRTMDILSVVGALLFGVGCGAVTAAVMYSLWALFNPRPVDFDEVSDDDEVILAKKYQYVPIPTQIHDDLKKAAPPAKEVV
ncbi:uncharacterized protein LOC131017655 [Salvia miltiorrhiza]|uniref:uncharacterized protein LOC131017655 n=1 Tax=Salvia miltiorrhiza TaxID=226208 RepID=UPI0025ABD682|nr:uncharacterized protein LOC131017655 [Salvia miltiorrhiza]